MEYTLLMDDETFSSHIGLHLQTVERPWSYYDLQGVISDHYNYFDELLE